jgi:Legume lectin domain
VFVVRFGKFNNSQPPITNLQHFTEPDNNPELNDNSDTHIHIQVTSNETIRELAEIPVNDIRTDPGVIGGVWIDYDGLTMNVYYNGKSDQEKPLKPAAMATVSLASLFRDTRLFFGFTAGTYNQGDNHDIVAWSFTS